LDESKLITSRNKKENPHACKFRALVLNVEEPVTMEETIDSMAQHIHSVLWHATEKYRL